MKKTKSKKHKLLFAVGTIATIVGAPFQALAASNSVECPSIGGKSSAEKAYDAGSRLAGEGFLNSASFAMDRAIRDGSANASTISSALACLARIEAQNPVLNLSSYDSIAASVFEKTKPNSAERRSIESYAFRSLVQALASGSKGRSLSFHSKVFSQPSAYRSAAQALISIARSSPESAKTAASIRAALAEIEGGTAAPETKEVRGFLILSLARNLYAAGATTAAIAEYEKLYRIGEPMQDALIESAWSHLRSKNYVKSIGLGYELSTGKLSEFFAPEALSIRAISLNENCRYPEAHRTVLKFKTEYGALREWLQASRKSSDSLYETAIARSEGAVGAETIPEKVWSMWSGSKLFISLQNAIQKSFREERDVKEWIVDQVEDKALQGALLANAGKLPSVRTALASRIEAHLTGLNRSMIDRIAAEGERIRFVSIEANQGAGRDLVYRNANPKIAEVEKKLAKEERKAKSYKGKLAWGKAKKDDPNAELWIDEIGAYEAHTLNRCGAKAKYKEMRASL